jgi:hypothetical protein
MKNLQELVIGSAVFLVIDRVSRLVSANIVKKGEESMNRASLHIELMILATVIILAWKAF